MKSIKELKLLANDNRKRIIEMIYRAKAGHPGGSLSIIDILTAIYELDVDFKNEKRSRVVLSKGHAVPAQYAILNYKGIIGDEELATFRHVDSRLQGHPHIVDIPEVDSTTGLLGQGLSLAIGMAMAKRNDNEDNRVYAIVGDGELHEGQIWEGIMQAAHYKLNNLVMIVDYNKLSSSGPVNEVIRVDSVSDKLKVFGFNTIEINGNDMEQVVGALEVAINEKEKPTAIIANTIKGKDVSFMENNPKWHSGALTDDEYKIAMNDINKVREEI
ncbi:transketolase [Clostridium neonatale]|uniref:transketolase n=1 Tax=Clostridium neonatale TaxID=137838 RepID=UPI003D32C1E5